MNFWITTHWPPRKDSDPNHVAGGIWLPDGRQAAGSDLKDKDKVLVYQARSGRSEIRTRIDGSKFVVPTIAGKEGVIAICEAQSEIFEVKDSKPKKYIDGTKIWWRWYTPLTILSKSGFVPREKMNPILGYKVDYNLHGFGDRHSGLKKITADQFNDLVKMFRSNVKLFQPKIKNISRENYGGEGGESPEHFLLKIYVASNPSIVLHEANVQKFEIEYPFPTGDRADILLLDEVGRILGVEIEVNVDDDQLEGLLQAIKYRYMSELMTHRIRGDSRAILIAYKISKKMKLLCKEYDIHCIEVDKGIVKTWSLSDEGKFALAEQQHHIS